MFTDFCESDDEYLAWLDAITHTHLRRIRLRVLDLEHRRLAALTDVVIDGQVTINVDRETKVYRKANLTLFDPTRSIGWEPDSPSALPLHMKRMVQLIDDRLVPGFGWVGCPLFTGPVEDFDRDGAEVQVLAQGKESLGGTAARSHTWAKGRKVVEVIRDLLELAGEAPKRIHLPQLNATLPGEFNVRRGDRFIAKARNLAASVDDHILFPDGRGHWHMRRKPTKPTITVGRNLLTAPARIDRPTLEFHNGWVILGAKPGGNKPRVSSGLVGLPKTNAFSAHALKRNGQPRWEIFEDERPNVKTDKRAREIAYRLRDERIRYAAGVSIDTLPFPHVEEWDLLRVKDPATGTTQTRLKEATIPLVGGVQTIGAVRRISRGKKHGGYRPASNGGL